MIGFSNSKQIINSSKFAKMTNFFLKLLSHSSRKPIKKIQCSAACLESLSHLIKCRKRKKRIRPKNLKYYHLEDDRVQIISICLKRRYEQRLRRENWKSKNESWIICKSYLSKESLQSFKNCNSLSKSWIIDKWRYTNENNFSWIKQGKCKKK